MVCPEEPELPDEELDEEELDESVVVSDGPVVSKLEAASLSVEAGPEGSTRRVPSLAPPGVVLIPGAPGANLMRT